MPKTGKVFTLLLNAAIFIVMEVAALNMLSSRNSMQNFFMSKTAHAFMGRVWGATQGIRYYFSLAKVNSELSDENFALRQALLSFRSAAQIDTLASQADSLSSLDIAGFHYMRGTIVKTGTGTQHNYIILGQGSEDGVQPRSSIITSKGIVGIIDAVGRHYSYGLSFMNTESSVSARLGREGVVGPMVWDGRSTSGAVLKEIPLQFKFQPGDTVFTSGFSSIYPPDIPLGTVVGSRIVNGATNDISIELFQDLASVRNVTIVTNVGAREVEELSGLADAPRKEKKKQED